jgi:hypothetical protein
MLAVSWCKVCNITGAGTAVRSGKHRLPGPDGAGM